MEAQDYLMQLESIMKKYHDTVRSLSNSDGGIVGVEPLKRVKQVQNEALIAVRELRSLLVLDEKELQAEYANTMSDAATNRHGWLVFFAGRAAAGRARANKKRAIANEKNRVFAPYREAKLSMDERHTRLLLSGNESPQL
jgi:hypothetical protein